MSLAAVPSGPVDKAALEKECAEELDAEMLGEGPVSKMKRRRFGQAQQLVLGERMRETLAAAATPEHLANLTGAALAKAMYAVLSGDVQFKSGDDVARFINAAGNWFLLLGGEPTQISTSLTPEQRMAEFERLKAQALQATSD